MFLVLVPLLPSSLRYPSFVEPFKKKKPKKLIMMMDRREKKKKKKKGNGKNVFTVLMMIYDIN